MQRALSLGIALIALTSTPAAYSSPDATARVRVAVVAFNDAYVQNDLDAYFGFYAADATLIFDTGRVVLEDYRKDWHQLVADGGAVESNVISDIQIQLSPAGDAAVASYQLEVRTRYPDGTVVTEHAWETDAWFKTKKGWRVAHINYTTRPAD